MPRLADTLGSLVDKLSIVNIKVWHCMDWVYESVKMTPEEFAEQGHDEIHGKLKKLAATNLERNRLMTEIDEVFARGVKTGKVDIDARTKLA